MCAAILEVTYTSNEVVLLRINEVDDVEQRIAALQAQPSTKKIKVFNPGKTYTQATVWQED